VARCRHHESFPVANWIDIFFSFDSSEDRGEFQTKIGVKKVIQGMSVNYPNHNERSLSDIGWDEGVVDMTLGEKAVLTIPG
jgi:FK506-binding protein 1